MPRSGRSWRRWSRFRYQITELLRTKLAVNFTVVFGPMLMVGRMPGRRSAFEAHGYTLRLTPQPRPPSLGQETPAGRESRGNRSARWRFKYGAWPGPRRWPPQKCQGLGTEARVAHAGPGRATVPPWPKQAHTGAERATSWASSSPADAVPRTSRSPDSRHGSELRRRPGGPTGARDCARFARAQCISSGSPNHAAVPSVPVWTPIWNKRPPFC